jgi:hypothetical protein
MSRPIPYSNVIIDPLNDLQVQHWSNDLRVQTYDLRAAIQLVGPRLSHLRRYFGTSAEIVCLKDRRGRPDIRTPVAASTLSASPPIA